MIRFKMGQVMLYVFSCVARDVMFGSHFQNFYLITSSDIQYPADATKNATNNQGTITHCINNMTAANNNMVTAIFNISARKFALNT